MNKIYFYLLFYLIGLSFSDTTDTFPPGYFFSHRACVLITPLLIYNGSGINVSVSAFSKNIKVFKNMVTMLIQYKELKKDSLSYVELSIGGSYGQQINFGNIFLIFSEGLVYCRDFSGYPSSLGFDINENLLTRFGRDIKPLFGFGLFQSFRIPSAYFPMDYGIRISIGLEFYTTLDPRYQPSNK